MENGTTGSVKRPRVDIVPHTAETAPRLVVGLHSYDFDRQTAVYFVKVLFDWLWATYGKGERPSYMLKGDE
jgi:hypothetical protein